MAPRKNTSPRVLSKPVLVDDAGNAYAYYCDDSAGITHSDQAVKRTKRVCASCIIWRDSSGDRSMIGHLLKQPVLMGMDGQQAFAWL